MVKIQREEIGTRLKRNDIRRVNYFKLNQGYDFADQDSEYNDDQDSYKGYKRIKKCKNKDKRERPTHDDLQVLLGWRKSIQLTPYEQDKRRVHVAKRIVGADLSKFGGDVQGILISSPFKKEFKNIQLPKKLIPNGIVFIWSDKSLITEMIECFEQQGFVYIENLVVVQLSLSKAVKEAGAEKQEEAVLERLPQLKLVKELMDIKQSKVLNTTKQVLMMFRRFDEHKSPLELRHQRTPDVLFDFENLKSPQSKEYIYQMIETLLPKSQLMELYLKM